MAKARRSRKGRPPKTGSITLPFGGRELNPHTIRVDRHKPEFVKNLYNAYVQAVGIENTMVCKFIKIIRNHSKVIAEEVTYSRSNVRRLWTENYR